MNRSLLRIALSLALPVAAHAQAPETTIDRAVSAYAKVHTARAAFEQVVTNPLTGTTVSARGDLLLQRAPNRFAVRFTDPDGDRIVGDGKSVWVYLPSTNPGQVMKLRMGATGAAGPDVVDDLLMDARAKYTITDAGAATLGGRAMHAVLLVPRQEKPFTRATVWIDDLDGTLRQFELTDTSGLVRRVRMTSIEQNVKIPGGSFSFTPPRGVKVYDQDAMTGGR